ncbi:hypothetical protein UY3_03956 [Chelonia mydas]|uniref:Uncharacterized protein n=1 Tax=Chelonia mydas TaxID=8469 RepID=M7CDI9_CHEMY|nr:hypothetical protein UY3_03956 [Chelonia mydas]
MPVGKDLEFHTLIHEQLLGKGKYVYCLTAGLHYSQDKRSQIDPPVVDLAGLVKTRQIDNRSLSSRPLYSSPDEKSKSTTLPAGLHYSQDKRSQIDPPVVDLAGLVKTRQIDNRSLSSRPLYSSPDEKSKNMSRICVPADALPSTPLALLILVEYQSQRESAQQSIYRVYTSLDS